MKVGISLAGGGLKGVAHIGAIKALEELGVEIEYITGTSSGAMMASLYAMGYTPEEIKEITTNTYKEITKIRKRTLLKEAIKYPFKRELSLRGLIDGNNVEKVINKFANKKEIKNISDIKKKFAMVTADAKSTKKCILSSSKMQEKENADYIYDIPIGKAIRASMSFPAIYTPCDFGKYCFIDGGTIDNLPVEVLKDLGAETTIAISFKLDEYKGDENLFSTILRACDIYAERDIRKGREEADISIEIDMNQAKLLEIKNVDESMQLGYDEVMKNKEIILGMVKVK